MAETYKKPCLPAGGPAIRFAGFTDALPAGRQVGNSKEEHKNE